MGLIQERWSEWKETVIDPRPYDRANPINTFYAGAYTVLIHLVDMPAEVRHDAIQILIDECDKVLRKEPNDVADREG